MRSAILTLGVRPAALVSAGLSAILSLAGCDKEPPSPAPAVDATAPQKPAEPPRAEASAITDASVAPAPASTWDGSMPPRPVPKTSPTVGSGMPMETQMRAIAYMAAMGQPQIDDAPADPKYAEQLAAQLRPIVMSLDHGPAEEKARLDRVEVVGSGRRIDLLLSAGCDAQAPMRAVVTRANVPLSTLRSHGVLVVRCNDARVQCLQSTRDPTDVLCTTAPRHR
jgi:hypothetical protein